MRKLLIKLGLLLVIVGGVCFVADGVYRAYYHLPYLKPLNIFPKPEIKEKYQIVKLGNSHSYDGISFAGYKLKSLDLSGTGQQLIYDLAFLHQYHRQIADKAVVLIPVTPISFSQKRANRTDGLQRLYFGQISPLYIPFLDLGDYLQQQFWPFMRVGMAVRDRYAKVVRKIFEDHNGQKLVVNQAQVAASAPVINTLSMVKASLPPSQPMTKETNQNYYQVQVIREVMTKPAGEGIGVWRDSVQKVFDKWMDTSEFSQEYFAQNRTDLEQIINYCRKQHWQPVLITIPISQALEKALPKDYKQVYIYNNLAQIGGQLTDYFDFSLASFPKSYPAFYANADHLNANGAAMFSYLLLRKLIDTGYLPAGADGYDHNQLYVEKE